MSETQALTQLFGDLINSCNEFEEAAFEEAAFNENDVVLVSLDDNPQRQEMIVAGVYENSLKLQTRDGKTHYFDPDVVVDNLGPASRTKLRMFGFEVPPEPPTPDYTTGTYVLNSNEGPMLAEVDRVDGNYYVHLVDSSNAEPLTPQIWDRLEEFSDLDGDGEYYIEPALYYVDEVKRFVEVVPYNGRCYYRFTDEAELYVLDKRQVPGMNRVESDTLEVNAAIVVPAPKKVEDQQECCGEPETCGT